MDWLNNPWVTGIGGGLVSGLLVFWITQRIFTNRNAAEYRQKIDATNREVIYAIRPGIPEGVVPETDVVTALVHSTARKYAVAVKDVYNSSFIAEDLMKEVMDSSFISAKQKLEYCKALRAMKDATANSTSQFAVTTLNERGNVGSTYLPMRFAFLDVPLMFGLLSAVLSAAILFTTTKQSTELLPLKHTPGSLVLTEILSVVLGAATIALIPPLYARILRAIYALLRRDEADDRDDTR